MATHVPVFSSTLQKTQAWLAELAERGNFQDESQAYTALRAVLHALRDRLTVEEATDLGAQLPMLVRGFYYEGYNPSKAPNKERHREEFIRHVQSSLHNANATIDTEAAIMAVFELLSKKVTAGEIDDVRHMMPKDLQDYWPQG
ncbi:MAG: DUF2267 domain-containing protein [Phycisphaeraceae bacterium]